MLAQSVADKLDIPKLESGLKDLWLNPAKDLPMEMQLRVRTCGLVSAVLYYSLIEVGYDASFYTSRTNLAEFFDGVKHAIVGLNDMGHTSYLDATYSQFLGLPELGTRDTRVIACYPDKKLLAYDATTAPSVAEEVEASSIVVSDRINTMDETILVSGAFDYTKVVDPNNYQLTNPSLHRTSIASVIDSIAPSLT